jgi:hypothetical protein
MSVELKLAVIRARRADPSLRNKTDQEIQEILRLGAEATTEAPLVAERETELEDRLNRQLLTRFGFFFAKDGFLMDNRNRLTPPRRVNRYPFKTTEEALGFLGGWILKLAQEANRNFKTGR